MHRLTTFSVRRPWLTVAAALVALCAAACSILRAELSTGLHAVLGPTHPELVRFEQFLERFGGGYPLLIAYECSQPDLCTSALDPAALTMADAVVRELTRSPFVSRVSSPATTPLLLAGHDGGIAARRLIDHPTDGALRRHALDDPLWRGTLISGDGRAGTIAVELVSTQSEVLFAIWDEIEDALAPFRRAGFRFHTVGEPVLWVQAHRDAVLSMLRVGIGTGTMLFLTLLLLLRSLPAVAASLATIGVAATCTMGILPLLDWQITEHTSGAATAILVIGCADCVHFVVRYLGTRATFGDDASAVVASSRAVLAPCFLTTATSAGSFAAFGSGGVHSLIRFGGLAAIGISLAFVLTFTLLPALLCLLRVQPRGRSHSDAWQRALGRLGRFSTHSARPVLAIAATAGLLGALGVQKLRVDIGLADLWARDHPVQQALDFVSTHFQGVDRLEVEIVLPDGVRLEDPAVIRVLRQVKASLSTIEGLGAPRSIETLLRHADRLLFPASSALDSESALGELVLIVFAGDPGAFDPWVTMDQRHLRVSVEAEENAEHSRLLLEAERRLRAELPLAWSFSLTGPLAVATIHESEFAHSQTTVVSAAALLVSALIAVYLRSLGWALLAMVPNAVALLLLFGAMGHLGIPLDFGSAIVAPLAIGIAADDTIHFLTAYARERRSGWEPIVALHRAILEVGDAVIATSTALALGFLSCITSPFPSVSSLGVLSAVAIVAASVADLVVLPALIATTASVGARSSLSSQVQRRAP